jgi:hypothetical protein
MAIPAMRLKMGYKFHADSILTIQDRQIKFFLCSILGFLLFRIDLNTIIAVNGDVKRIISEYKGFPINPFSGKAFHEFTINTSIKRIPGRLESLRSLNIPKRSEARK